MSSERNGATALAFGMFFFVLFSTPSWAPVQFDLQTDNYAGKTNRRRV